MKRSRIDQDLVSKRPLDSQSILGIADGEPAPKLVLKLHKRKNVKSGMVPIRPCLCQGSILNQRSFSSVHRIWPVIKRTIRPVEFIFLDMLNRVSIELPRRFSQNKRFPTPIGSHRNVFDAAARTLSKIPIPH